MERLEHEVREAAKRAGLPAASELLEVWPAVVGETIAANAWPAKQTRAGLLVVNTTSTTWAFELKHLAPKILEKLKLALPGGCPSELRFVPGPVPGEARAAGEQMDLRTPVVGDEERLCGEELAASVSDKELRELIARAAAASLAKSSAKTRFGHTSSRPF
jgi:hypothetical protein